MFAGELRTTKRLGRTGRLWGGRGMYRGGGGGKKVRGGACAEVGGKGAQALWQEGSGHLEELQGCRVAGAQRVKGAW